MSEMTPDELKFKTSLIFWKLYETGLTLKPKKVQNALKNDDRYSNLMYEGYSFANNNGERMPLKWIASTGNLFLPVCLNLLKSTFHVKNHPQIQGNILIDAHIYPEGVIVMQSRMDFANFHTINDLIYASVPSDVLLPTEHDMKSELDQLEATLLQFIIDTLSLKQREIGEKASPWHHNWIWWENSQQIPNQAFDIGGTHFTYALGMCTRSDKWRSLDYTKYNQIETVRNLSPYNGSCVYITHPGNCIIPGFEMTDPHSVKNTLIDVIFGAEVGNVQRYMILEHLQNLNFERMEIEQIMETYDQDESLSLKEIVEKLDKIETDINKIILEIYGDLQVSRTPRLLFTSVFKTRIFKQMVESLHGWEFNNGLMKLIDEIRDSLSRERDSVKMRLDEEENSFLKNLQIVFVIGLVAQMITLFYAVDSFDLNLGTIFTGISVVASVVILWILKKLK